MPSDLFDTLPCLLRHDTVTIGSGYLFDILEPAHQIPGNVIYVSQTDMREQIAYNMTPKNAIYFVLDNEVSLRQEPT